MWLHWFGVKVRSCTTCLSTKTTLASLMSPTAYQRCKHLCRHAPSHPDRICPSICELQADTIVRRYPSTRIASLRPSWCIPNREYAQILPTEKRKDDLWGWVHEDAAAQAFLLAVDLEDKKWTGHEAFFIVEPETTEGDAPHLYEQHWKHVPIKAGKDLSKGFFDCTKAERLLGWIADLR